MSGFVPEGYVGKDAVQGLNTSGASDQVELSDYELGLLQKLFSAPNRIPAAFFSYLTSYIEQANLLIPVSQISGFTQFNAQIASTVLTSESTTSTTYTDLATVGPSLANIPDGKYLLVYGCTTGSGNPSTTTPRMAIKVNTTEAVDDDSCFNTNAGVASVMMVVPKTLANGGSNSLTARYRVEGGASSPFRSRWLIALRYSNA